MSQTSPHGKEAATREQLTQPVDDAPEYCPAGQSVQAAADAPENLPAGQARQDVPPLA
jgi:hypothetical protein